MVTSLAVQQLADAALHRQRLAVIGRLHLPARRHALPALAGVFAEALQQGYQVHGRALLPALRAAHEVQGRVHHALHVVDVAADLDTEHLVLQQVGAQPDAGQRRLQVM